MTLVLASANTGFYVGLVLAFAVIVVVVALVATILAYASRVAEQAAAAADVLAKVRDRTAILPEIGATAEHLEAIKDVAITARGVLGG